MWWLLKRSSGLVSLRTVTSSLSPSSLCTVPLAAGKQAAGGPTIYLFLFATCMALGQLVWSHQQTQSQNCAVSHSASLRPARYVAHC
jgi:hypothetical protein